MNALDEQLYLQLKAQIDALGGGGGGGVSFDDAEGDPEPLGVAADGSSIYAARRNHVHAHGNLAGGTLHAAATSLVDGFLAAFDKTVIDSRDIVPVSTSTSSLATAFNDALAAAALLGKKHIHFPDGTWTANCGGLTDDSFLVSVPDGFTVSGNGPGRSIISVVNTSTGGGIDGVNLFITATSGGNIIFDGLDFVGDNGTSVGTFTYVLNNQNSCIRIATTAGKNIIVRNCVFRQLWGFTVHDVNTSNERVHFYDNKVESCANGTNICASYSLQARNVVLNSEGFETSGRNNILAFNIIQDAWGTALNIGGDQTPGLYTPGCLVIGNTVDGCTGNGIAITDGSEGFVIANNAIRECTTGGIIVNGAVTAVRNGVFIGNALLDNCSTLGANLVGMNIQDGDGGHLIFGNICVNTGATAGFAQSFGLSLRVPNCCVEGNMFSGGTIDAVFDGNATNTRFGASNLCVNGTEQWLGSATRSPLRSTGKVASDIIEFSRIYNLSTLSSRAYWYRQADGKQWWGDNLNPVDTNLYRSAADTLATDDALAVGGALAVTGNLVVHTSALKVDASTDRVTVGSAAAKNATLWVGNHFAISGDRPSAADNTSYPSLWMNNNASIWSDASASFAGIGFNTNIHRISSAGGWALTDPTKAGWTFYLGHGASVDYLKVSRTAAAGNPNTPTLLLGITNAGALTAAGGGTFGDGLSVTSSAWLKGDLITTGVTAHARQGSDANGLNFTTNIRWTGAAWVADDSAKKSFAYIQHLGNSRHEFRVAPVGSVTFSTPFYFDDSAANFAVPLTISSVAVPTISSADNLQNKTITSPTLAGTVAGSVIHSGNNTHSGANTYSGLSTFTSGTKASTRSTVATTVTMATTDEVILVDATAGAVTVNLQAAATAANGRRLTVVKTDGSAFAVTLDGSGAETINGATTLVLAAQYDRATLVCNGTAWFRID